MILRMDCILLKLHNNDTGLSLDLVELPNVGVESDSVGLINSNGSGADYMGKHKFNNKLGLVIVVPG